MTVDEFLIKLIVDPTQATAGSKAASDAMKQASSETEAEAKKIEANAKRQAKALDDLAKRTFESFSKLRTEVLNVFAAIVGAASFKQLVQNTATAEAATSRFSERLGLSAREVATWQTAARAIGGTNEGVASTFESLSNSIENLKFGDSSIINALTPLQSAAAQLGGVKFDLSKGPAELLKEISHNLALVAEKDPALANSLAHKITSDEAMVRLLLQGRGKLQAALEDAAKDTPGFWDFKAAREIADAWNRAANAVGKVASEIVTALSPAIIGALDIFAGIARAIGDLAEKHQGATQAIEIIIGLIAGDKIIQGIKNVFMLKNALLDLAAAEGAVGAAGSGGTLARLLGLGKRGAIAGGIGLLAAIKADKKDPAHPFLKSMREFFGIESGDTATGSSAGNLTGLIKEAAGGDQRIERIMEGIRAGESGHGERYDKKDDAIESSWGPFQLNRRNGLGVQFEKETGLDLRDPSTIPAQARWVADYLRNGGSTSPWAGYHGPRDANPDWGDSGYRPLTVHGPGPQSSLWPSDLSSYPTVPAMAGIGGASSVTNNNSAPVHIGSVVINSKTNDPAGHAREFQTEIERVASAGRMNYGIA